MSTVYKPYNDFGKQFDNLKVTNAVILDALGGSGLRMLTVSNTGVVGAQAIPSGGGGLVDGDYGDIVVSGTGTIMTIDTDAVSNAKLANMANNTFKARITAGSGDPEDITVTQATSMLNVVTSTLKGLAPASGGGTVNFLRADGTWAAPPSGGGGTPGGSDRQVQFNNAGAFGGNSNLVLNTAGELLIGGVTDQGAYSLQAAGGFYFRHSAADIMSYSSSGLIQILFGQSTGKIVVNKSYAGSTVLDFVDNTAGYMKFGSASGTGFLPYIVFRPDGTIQTRALFSTEIITDTGTTAALQIDSSLYNGTALAVKPLFAISSGLIDKVLVNADGTVVLSNYNGVGNKIATFTSTGLLQRGAIDPANIATLNLSQTFAGENTFSNKLFFTGLDNSIDADKLLGFKDSSGNVSEVALGANLSLTTNTLSVTAAGSNTQIQFNNSGALGGTSNFTWNNGTSAAAITGTLGVNKPAVTSPTTGSLGENVFSTINWNSAAGMSSGSVYASIFSLETININAGVTFDSSTIHSGAFNLLRFGSTTSSTSVVSQSGSGVRAVSANAAMVQLDTVTGSAVSSIDYVAGVQIFAPQATNGSGVSAASLVAITNYYGLLIGDPAEYSNSNSKITNKYGIYQSGSGDSNVFAGTKSGFGHINAPTASIDVSSTTGYNQFRMRATYTPSSSSDTNGNIGDVSWDASFIYVKTSGGWKRTALSTF